MNKKLTPFYLLAVAVALTATACTQRVADPYAGLDQDTLVVRAARFSEGAHMVALKDSVTSLRFVLQERELLPFNQANIHQTTEQAKLGPAADKPFFTVRLALPIPPAYTPTEQAELTGIDGGVYHHNHSPGFEIMPNGDALAIYFSTPMGLAEKDPATTFIQARLRHGSEDWDMPELFFETIGGNDQSGLLWNDNGKIWFFGGGRSMSEYVPFRIATSTDNGFHWEFSVPQLDTIATDYTAQPVSSAFRDPAGNIYFVCDGKGSTSFLWRSSDEGKTWVDMGGRTGTRHSTIVPLDEEGNLISMGGKNNNCEGWNVKNFSSDWGATWSENEPSYFPVLGTAQRPSLIRLESGALLYVGDGFAHKRKIAPPKEWEHGYNAVVAISDDEGETWKIKELPAQLPQHRRPPYGTLGYCTVRQAPNGVIHLLTTVNYPNLHYEFNEAWVRSDAGEVPLETEGGEIKSYTEYYDNGALKSKWSARICPDGRYLLHGEQKDYFDSGVLEHEVCYENGRKCGIERFYTKQGTLRWQWERDLKSNRGVWTHYHPNGAKRIVSRWNLRPEPRDLKRAFYGYVAEGQTLHFDEEGNQTASYIFKNGVLQE